MNRFNLRKILIFIIVFILLTPIISNASNQEESIEDIKKKKLGDIPMVEFKYGENESDYGEGVISLTENIKDDNGNQITQNDTWNLLFEKYAEVITGVSAMSALTAFGVFVVYLIKLAQTGDNPSERKNVLSGLLYASIGVAILGGVTLFASWMYNIV